MKQRNSDIASAILHARYRRGEVIARLIRDASRAVRHRRDTSQPAGTRQPA